MRFSLKRVIFVLGIILVLMVAGIVYGNSYEYEYNIFSQIDELNVLSDYIVDDAEDKNAEGLAYNERFCHVVEYEGNKYTVCAYEFVDPESSKVYYERAWGEKIYINWYNCWMSSYSSFWGCKFISFEENRVLPVITAHAAAAR